MSDIQFQTDDQNEFGSPQERPAGFDLASLLMRWRIVENHEKAQYVLLGTAAVAGLIGMYFFYQIVFSPQPSAPPIDMSKVYVPQ